MDICTMATNEKEIELAWIKEVLEKRGSNLIDTFKKALTEQKLIRTGNLLGSLGYKVDQDASADAVLSIIFSTYGRIQDHGVKKTVQQTKRESKLMLLGNPTMKRIPKRWYVKNLYSELDRMIYELIYGLDQGTKEILRQQLTQLNTAKNGNE